MLRFTELLNKVWGLVGYLNDCVVNESRLLKKYV
jgi:hypothetical protein